VGKLVFLGAMHVNLVFFISYVSPYFRWTLPKLLWTCTLPHDPEDIPDYPHLLVTCRCDGSYVGSLIRVP